MRSENQNGRVITFYSYKGGSGRTMALANIACLLAQKEMAACDDSKSSVLMIDWDLEAPGLHEFFAKRLKVESGYDIDAQPGLIELLVQLDQYAHAGDAEEMKSASAATDIVNNVELQPYLVETTVPGLHLMKAGRFDKEYPKKINTFPWESLFYRCPYLFQELARKLASSFKYVLIDSRTGVTDISGICTAIMPETLVVVFTPNQQSLNGLSDVVREAARYRRESGDIRDLIVYPLASRLDLEAVELRKKWRFGNGIDTMGYQRVFEGLFEEVYRMRKVNLDRYFDVILLQHTSDYAYGEPLPVLYELHKDRLTLAWSYEEFLKFLTSDASPWTPVEAGDDNESTPPIFGISTSTWLESSKRNLPKTFAAAALLVIVLLAMVLVFMRLESWTPQDDLTYRIHVTLLNEERDFLDEDIRNVDIETSQPTAVRRRLPDGSWEITVPKRDLRGSVDPFIEITARGAGGLKGSLKISLDEQLDISHKLPLERVLKEFTGRVLDAGTGKPISEARVHSVGAAKEYHGVTGPDGGFSLSLPIHTLSIVIEHPRYASKTFQIRRDDILNSKPGSSPPIYKVEER